VLTTLVREYIETGEPVSSQALVRASGLGVSSATIRNVLAQLEELGFVSQPHTSAGRIPTDRAYRVFVDLLLESRTPVRPPVNMEYHLRQQADRFPFPDELLASATHLISRTAGHVGFALAGSQSGVLQRIEFVPLGGSRVLVVVISRGNQVMQKVIDAGEDVTSADLVHAGNYLNTEFAGVDLLDVREGVLSRLRQERTLYDQLVARALRLAHSTLDGLSSQHTFHVEGAASLLDGPDDVSLATLRALLEMMEEKARMVRLLNEYIDGPGLTIVIGAEHTVPGLRAFSLVASTVVDDGATRTVGVIGPMRMHYSRAIALVDGTTRAVSRVLRGPDHTTAHVS
jgi:heat-inducible transcriptional repressor